jgi:hypothetical protein
MAIHLHETFLIKGKKTTTQQEYFGNRGRTIRVKKAIK